MVICTGVSQVWRYLVPVPISSVALQYAPPYRHALCIMHLPNLAPHNDCRALLDETCISHRLNAFRCWCLSFIQFRLQTTSATLVMPYQHSAVRNITHYSYVRTHYLLDSFSWYLHMPTSYTIHSMWYRAKYTMKDRFWFTYTWSSRTPGKSKEGDELYKRSICVGLVAMGEN